MDGFVITTARRFFSYTERKGDLRSRLAKPVQRVELAKPDQLERHESRVRLGLLELLPGRSSVA